EGASARGRSVYVSMRAPRGMYRAPPGPANLSAPAGSRRGATRVECRAVGLLSPLTPDERSTFLVVALPEKSLVKLAGRLGTAPPGTRLDRLGTWDLAWSLVDYYDSDPEVAEAVDRTLRKEIGEPALGAAVADESGGRAVKERLVELERSVEAARRDLRSSEEERARLASERDRLLEEREGLRARLQSGTAAEVARLAEELEAMKRRARALEADVDEARERE